MDSMDVLHAIFNVSELSGPLASALVHSVWQFCLIAIIYWFAKGFLISQSAKRPQHLYRFGLFSIGMMLVCFCVSVAWQVSTSDANATSINSSSPSLPIVTPSLESSVNLSANSTINAFSIRAQKYLDGINQKIVFIWLVGVALLLIRTALGLINVCSLANQAHHSSLPLKYAATASDLKDKFAISNILIAISDRVAIPSVIGFLKPIVLVPSSAILNLNAKELELVIAHELAHVKRNDYIINLLQIIVESIFFYHPALWWIAAEVRREREKCCDDLAIEKCGNPQFLVSALLSLEEKMNATPQLAANGGSLIDRCRRLLGSDHEKHRSYGFGLVMLATVLFCTSAIFMTQSNVSASQDQPATAPATTEAAKTQSTTQSELKNAVSLTDDQKRDLMRDYIFEKAKEANVTVSDQELLAYESKVAKKFGVEPKRFRAMLLKERKMTAKQYREQNLCLELLRKLVSKEFNVTVKQAELDAEFESEYGPQAKVLAILTNDKSTIIKVFQLYQTNPTEAYFRKLAEEYSTSPTHQTHVKKLNGAYPAVTKEAFGLKPNELSPVIQSGGSWVLLYGLGKTKPVEFTPETRKQLESELSANIVDKRLINAMQTLVNRYRKDLGLE